MKRLVLLTVLIYLCYGGGIVVAEFSDLLTARQISDPRVTWVQFGPGSAGYNESTWFHPTKPDVMYTTPDMFNSYRSIDGGLSWHTVLDYDGSDTHEYRFDRVFNMDFCTIDPNIGMAVNRLGLWHTIDKGESWSADPGNASNKWGGHLSAVAFDPVNQGTIYLGSGNFWAVKGNARTYDRPHGSTHPWLHQTGPRNQGKIWRSTDAGKSWELANDGLPRQAEIGVILVDPLDPNIVYAATSYGFFRSNDQGQSWHSKSEGLDNDIIRDFDMYVNRVSGEVILYVIDLIKWEPADNRSLTVSGGVFKSTDRGETWVPISDNLRIDLTAINSSVINNAFYGNRALGSWFGISPEEARKLYVLPRQITPLFNRLVVDPNNPERIYVSHNPRHGISLPLDGVWMTEDGGDSWWHATRIGSGWRRHASYWRRHSVPDDVDLSKENMDLGHIANKRLRGIEYSVASGVRSMAINSRGELLIDFEQQLLVSRDNGRSWQQIDQVETEPGSGFWVGAGNSNMPGRHIYQDPRIPDSPYFTSGEHGLWRVRPGGDLVSPGAVAVEQISEQAESPAQIAFHPKDINTIYMLAFRQRHVGQFLRSTDGGYTWRVLSRPISEPGLATHQYSLLIDPEDPNNIYFCVPQDILYDVRRQEGNAETGVYASYDGGYSWEVQNKGLSNTNVHRLAFDNNNSSILYAVVLRSGNSSGGLYRSYDRGLNWEQVHIPQEIDHVNHVHLDRQNNIYISTGRDNGGLESGGVWRSIDSADTWERIFHLPVIMMTTTADYDHNRILVVARPGNANERLNPGVYLSEDFGETWIKINTGLGLSDRMMDVAFDLTRSDILWATSFGSGFYKGTLESDLASVYRNHLQPKKEMFSLQDPVSDQTDINPEMVTLSWQSADAASYTVKVASDSNMETIVWQDTVADSEVVIRDLDYGKTYYWKVKANPDLPWHSDLESEYIQFVTPAWNQTGVSQFSTKTATATPK